jgi:peptide/nickel transport system permease protein
VPNEGAPTFEQAEARSSPSALRRFARHPEGIAGAGVLLAVVAVAIFAPILAPHDPTEQFSNGLDTYGLPRPPSFEFPLGTDDLGRDILSRLIFGARTTLGIALAANVVAVFVGASIGIAAGFFGGIVDTALMRFTDLVLAFPALLLAMALVAVAEPTPASVIAVLGCIQWTYVARLVRSRVALLMRQEFIAAARSIGVSSFRLVTRHLAPNLLPAVVVWATSSFATTILAVSALSYLGIGVQPPDSDWGQMIDRGQDFFREAPGITIFPGLALCLVSLAVSLLGEALRATLDPASRRARSAREERNARA